MMKSHRVDWVGILDGEKLLGWVGEDELAGRSLSQVEPKPFAVSLRPASSLREALNSVVVSHARVAVVVEDGRYLGMVDLEGIAEEITE